jgi:hypothetical protein
MRRLVFIAAACLAACAAQAASPLDGKTYMIEMSSSQSKSGYGDYLLPPLTRVLDNSRLRPWEKLGPGADVIFNIVTHSDVGQWIKTSKGREWLYTQTITIGISPESYTIPFEGTPQFGVAATLVTPNSDREDELTCLIRLAAREAIARYKPRGIVKVSGQSCLRKP